MSRLEDVYPVPDTAYDLEFLHNFLEECGATAERQWARKCDTHVSSQFQTSQNVVKIM